jgi:hypothetical protein
MSEHVFVSAVPSDVPGVAYAYLLGIYLGDGWVGLHCGTGRLTISLDKAYPAIVDEVVSAARLVLPTARVRALWLPDKACVSVYSYGLGWLERFPQHGRGPKHLRPIELEPWQRVIVDAHPWSFLRGRVHSDGCRTVNRFSTRLPSGRVAEYAYPRYFFSNLSADILGLFCATCDRLGLRWTRSNVRNVSVAHRASVDRMDEFIGPKR